MEDFYFGNVCLAIERGSVCGSDLDLLLSMIHIEGCNVKAELVHEGRVRN